MRSRSTRDRTSSLLAFLRTEEASAILLFATAAIALLWANSPFRGSYASLWTHVATLQIGEFHVTKDLQHWVNDGLMTLFFLVVGLEIKRETVSGELRDRRKLALPAFAALGGMVVPATIFLVLNRGTGTAGGWGVPTATDIAFALGILTLAASRAPVALRSFLLTLAIVDDIGAILLVALVYTAGVALPWLAVSAVILALVLVLGRLRVSRLTPYFLLLIALWVAFEEAGVHPTLAGVVIGLLLPATLATTRAASTAITRQYLHEAQGASDGDAEAYWLAVSDTARSAIPPLDRAESALHPWSSRFVVPMFALANAGIVLDGAAVTEVVTSAVGQGVILGLVVGKPLGILGAVWATTRSGIGRLPAEVTSRMILGVAVLAGVGFTVSLFIAELAFGSPRDVDVSKLAVLVASLLASVLGAVFLRSGGLHRRGSNARPLSSGDSPRLEASRADSGVA